MDVQVAILGDVGEGRVMAVAERQSLQFMESAMTGAELLDVFLSSEFKQGLEEMSSYLASIMQERPIVYLLARCLWRQGYKFELEKNLHDLSLNGQRIEFKFNYNRCENKLRNEMEEYGNNLKGMWECVEAGVISKSWGIMPRIYEDVCVRQPDMFVWIICSRDLSKVTREDRKRICLGPAQWRYNKKRPYSSDGERLTVVDSFLTKLQDIRTFSLLKEDIHTNGDFPSTYHLRICDFGESDIGVS
jgi:hypothetical protein